MPCRWHGIFLVTDAEGDPKSTAKVGSRFPGVFYFPKYSIYDQMIMVKLGMATHYFRSKEVLVVDEPTSVKISHEMEDGKLMYKVKQLN